MFQVGDRVVKNPATWVEEPEFSPWRGEGVGQVVEPPFALEENVVDVRWSGGRCFEPVEQLLKWEPTCDCGKLGKSSYCGTICRQCWQDHIQECQVCRDDDGHPYNQGR